ncbi:MAG: alpha-galactosidase [Clostridia bacterium]|nr:alpha-galactosidase [Clostridia bacterium]
MHNAQQFFEALITESRAPFCFTYDGAPFAQCLLAEKRQPTADGLILEYRFPDGLTVATRVTYHTFGAVEWVNTFSADGDTPTGVIGELWDADVFLPMAYQEKRPRSAYLRPEKDVTQVLSPAGSNLSEAEFRWQRAGANAFDAPHLLFAGWKKRFSASGGRSSQGDAPFFNFHYRGEGYFAAVGWTGQWHAEVQREETSLRFRAGIEDANFRLLPGEKIRTASIVLLPYRTHVDDSFNLWRRLVKADFSLIGQPGRADHAPFCASLWGGMPSDEAVRRIKIINEADIPVDTVWMDAGWYGPSNKPSPDEFEGDWGEHTGDWRVNPHLHPDGLREVSRAVHEGGKNFLLWVEPERLRSQVPTVKTHPAYCFAPVRPEDENRLLNLGFEDALQACFETLAALIEDLQIDWYRQDFNMDPLPVWRFNDAPDRRGISEIKHIMGLYRLWDALLAKFPHLMIDNCASGGRRIDIETLRRSVPLWRSDMQCPANFAPELAQTHALQFDLWLPYSGTGVGRASDVYRYRSAFAPALNTGFAYAASEPFGEAQTLKQVKRRAQEYLRVRPWLSEDVYPLTSPGTEADTWNARQLHRPSDSSGVILCFRREKSPFSEAVFPLRALERGKTYLLTDADTNETVRITGDELSDTGICISLPEKRSAKLLFYKTEN